MNRNVQNVSSLLFLRDKHQQVYESTVKIGSNKSRSFAHDYLQIASYMNNKQNVLLGDYEAAVGAVQ